jgi:hypothetical protein
MMNSNNYFLKTPSTPLIPIPETTSRVKRKGISSECGSSFPCSKAIPEKKTTKFE